MKLTDFEKQNEFVLKLRWGTKKKMGSMGNREDIKACDFVGVYVIYNKNDEEIVYIGCAYTEKTHAIKERLLIQQDSSDFSNSSLINCLINNKIVNDRISATQYIKENLNFVAYEHVDLEHYLIKTTSNILNRSGINQS